MEKLIEAEKKRGQQAIDYVRNTLKVRLRLLMTRHISRLHPFSSHSCNDSSFVIL